MTEERNNSNSPAESKADKPAKTSKKSSKPSFFSRVAKWFRELRSESKKVIWPTRKQVINNTGIVVATVAFVGAFVWIVDALLNMGVKALIQLL